MDDNGQRENGRHKADAYNKSLHTQWMMPPHQMKDPHTLKLMTLMAERDKAIQERNMAITEKRAALAERDIAFLHRDAAIAERNNAIMERDNAVATLEYARENGVNSSSGTGCASPHSGKHIHHHHLHHQQQQHVQHLHLQQSDLSESPYHPSREMHISEAYPISVNSEGAVKLRKGKRPKKETQAAPTKKTPRPTRKSKKGGGEDLNKQIKVPKQQSEWRDEGEDLNGQAGATKSNEWKGQELGLNVVTFDDSTMPVPVCSCTGKYQQCYKWGNGGWQSACCTTTLSMYPLPVMENKRHARVGGRKMSGGVFTKLLSRLAAEGHDMSVPLDLKDHWAKHGTNRYITIK